jgi:mRNA-degrading endonuclease RelE of RelBE toxin-antitoxin system
VPSISYHRDALSDLAHLDGADPEAASVFDAVFEQIHADPSLLLRLDDEHSGELGLDLFNVDKVEVYQQTGYNIWRLKCWNIKGLPGSYRVIYAVDAAKKHFYVLGIIHRDICYDVNHPRACQCRAAYEELAIPRIGPDGR